MKNECLLDKLLINISISFIIIPIILFFIFYLKWFISIPIIIVLLRFWYQLSKKIKYKELNMTKKDIIKLIFVIIITLIWIKYSGIGSFSYQNLDFEVRNAIFNDLINYDWPITFSKNISFSYYFTYWIPAALIGKMFGTTIANYFLYFYSVIQILLIIYLIKRFTKKDILLITFILIFFSGLDVVGTIITNTHYIYKFSHLERWSIFFQYSSITTCIYWVFNQAIPIYLITSLFLNIEDNKYTPALLSLSFSYSPWATIGLIPFAIINLFNKKIKQYINLSNILVILSMLIIYGSFYLSNKNSVSINGFIWNTVDKPLVSIIGTYLIFISLEFIMYIPLTFKKYKNNKYYLCSIISLVLIPLYRMTPANDFCMRVSLSAIFILMCFVIKAIDFKRNKDISIVIIILLIIGSVTPFNEMARSIDLTSNSKNYLRTSIKSLSKIPKKEKVLEKQFYVNNYKETFFYKYLAK